MLRSLLILLAALPLVAAVPAPDWSRIQAETTEHFLHLLRLDTSSPPGNETKAVEYIRSVLEREGIASQTFAKIPERANLVARLKGSGKNRPLLIMGHTDVVGTQRDKWQVNPFSATRENGYIRGRGALDDKDNLVSAMMLMVLLKRLQVPLDRDVIFLAEADEESSGEYGIQYMVREHWPEIEAEFALAEGGGALARGREVIQVSVSTTEKVPRRVTLLARGTAGHGSVPRLDNPVTHLANAVAKAAAWQTPMKLNDTTRAYFERLGTISSPEDRTRFNALMDPARSAAVQRYFQEQRPSFYSMLRTSISPTVLKAGFRENVIPSTAEATLDIRAVPDEDMPKFYKDLAAQIGDPAIEIVPLGQDRQRPAAAPSRLDSPMFRALEAAQRKVYPGAITLPSMLTGATDMAFLRAKGVPSYGIGPAVQEKDALCCGAHSDDEKVEEAALHQFVRYLWEAVTEVAAAK